ncbi:hypothetical protein [Scytonema sp. NUACC26]|uniref:hypothetical protein n=1 Tax=Scytonema sp. NUACC26 TaxID=3140176 RepID=UPI0034DBC47E
MTNLSNSDARYFLTRFFGAGNEFNLSAIEGSEGKQAKIRPWVERLTQVEPQLTILPCWRHKGNKEAVDWYAIARSERAITPVV